MANVAIDVLVVLLYKLDDRHVEQPRRIAAAPRLVLGHDVERHHVPRYRGHDHRDALPSQRELKLERGIELGLGGGALCRTLGENGSELLGDRGLLGDVEDAHIERREEERACVEASEQRNE